MSNLLRRLSLLPVADAEEVREIFQDELSRQFGGLVDKRLPRIAINCPVWMRPCDCPNALIRLQQNIGAESGCPGECLVRLVIKNLDAHEKRKKEMLA